jgi:hypothetical protein
MRRILIGAAALAVAGPAAADAPRPADPRDRAIVESIPNPAEVEAMGETLDRVVGAVLDIRVGPLIDAIDAADPEGRRDRRRYRKDETVGDIASDGDPYFEERLSDQIRGAAAGMGVMVEQLAVMAPEMRRAIERAERDVARAIDDARERREKERARRR